MNQDSSRRSKPASLREQYKQATALAILDAVESMLAEQGAAVSLSAVAARAGVAVGTIYNYYADRDELLLKLFETRRAEMLAVVDAALKAGADTPFREQLVGFVFALLSHFDARRAFVRIALDHDSPLGHTPRGRTTAFRALQKRTARLIESGVREKVLEADGSDLYAGMLLGMIRGVLLLRLDDPGPLSACAPRLTQVFLHGTEAQR